MSDIKIEGLDKLIKQLKEIREDSDSVVEKGLLRGAERVCADAKLRCPVSSGALRNSIHTEKVAPLTVSVGTNLEYAVPVEYGTGTKGDPAVPHTQKEFWRWQDEDGNWHTSHGQAAQPFLRPAAAAQKENVIKDVNDEIRAALSPRSEIFRGSP